MMIRTYDGGVDDHRTMSEIENNAPVVVGCAPKTTSNFLSPLLFASTSPLAVVS